MKCRYCGAENRDDYKYCLMCGKPLHEEGKGRFVPDKKIIIAAAAAAALLLAVILWPRGSKEVFHHYNSRPFFRSDDNGIAAISSSRKPEGFLEGKSTQILYSFDRSVMGIIILKDDNRSLYIYSEKGLRKLAEDVDSYQIAHSGDYVIYKTRSDEKWYHLTVKNGKSAEFFDESENSITYMALSVAGETIAYKASGEKSCISVFTNGKTREYEVEKVNSILAVMADGSVLFINGDYELCSLNGGKVTVLTSQPEYLFLNDDGSECAILAEGMYRLYRKGKLLTSEDPNAGKIAALIYPDTMCSSYTRSYVNRKYIYCYHYGVSTFTDRYFLTDYESIIRIDSKLQVSEIASDVSEVLISNDGSKLVYTDYDGNIFVHDGKKTAEINTDDYKASRLYAYDSVNDGIYYRSKNN
ncbi:MAG: zinc ribbon domain-containing protein, partial [Erysipelotrichaceae bacterium]|nr:zinc ribbon domain-containing protein [Erysipelotrichaceae bacterium]